MSDVQESAWMQEALDLAWKGRGQTSPNPMVGAVIVNNGEVVGRGDFARQFEQVFANLGGVLKGIGADYSSVVKFTTFLVEPDDIDSFMELRAALFPKLYPARVYPPNTLLIVKRLVKAEFLLEVEAVVSVSGTT